MNKILITAALPYANGPLHFGHIAGAYLPADAYCRFERLLGKDVLFICGSDEYGIAITLNAEKAQQSYQNYVDYYHHLHKEFFKKLNINFDHFSRTTNPYHKECVENFYNDLKKNGYICEKETQQLFCEKENRFLADRYVEGTCPQCSYNYARGDECQNCGASYEATDLINPHSKVSGESLIRKVTVHDFLLLPLFKDRLLDYFKIHPLRDNVKNFVKTYIDNLKPRAISRDLNWGIPVPNKPKGKVLYVWFDAPIGYISATKEWAEKVVKDSFAWEKYWLDSSTRYVQFIGKDNILFHAVVFPAMELGQNISYKMVDQLVVNEFLQLEGKQFSKSDGIYVDLDKFLNVFSVDQIRYVLAANAPEVADSEFTWEDFQKRCNSELVGKFGNFVNRVVSFALKNEFVEISCPENLDVEDIDFLSQVIEISIKAQEHYANFSLRKAVSCILELSQLGNVYLNNQAPWLVIKNEEKRPLVYKTLFCSLFCQKVLALISYPIMPETALKIFSILGINIKANNIEGIWREDFFLYVQDSFKLEKVKLLFSLVEDKDIAKFVN